MAVGASGEDVPGEDVPGEVYLDIVDENVVSREMEIWSLDSVLR